MANAQAQLDSLTQQRYHLYQTYKETESQHSGIFGNRTKEDQQASIDALTEILAKDDEILDELSRMQDKSRTEMTGKYNEAIQQNNELSQKYADLLELTERQKGWTKESHSTLSEIEENANILKGICLVLALLLIYFIVKFYSIKKI
ncbi:MAG: hypothetical protein KA313_02960 [Pseudarcicella sp.]|jgi:predicted phage tail protein|nr:hypothetical protein [Pseudarcicella sp.]